MFTSSYCTPEVSWKAQLRTYTTGGQMDGRNRHHVFWPKKDYKTPIERQFRSLGCNIVWIDEKAHTLLHIYTKPPEKPSHDDMCAAIWRHDQGFCSCGS